MVMIQDIWKAKKRIASIARKTPLLHSPAISEMTNGNVYLKLETVHEMGAFKIRGSANKMLSLTPEEQNRGVTTFSTGNHGLAVAYVAKQLGINATICVSNRVPKAKREAIQKYGGNLEIYGNSQDEAEFRCFELQHKHGVTVIKPFDDLDVIAGQGTIGLELLDAHPGLNTVLVPLSGGGLVSGVALALKINQPDIKVIGISIEQSPVMYESLKAGRPIELEEEDSLADSLLGGIGLDNRHTFSMVQQFVDDVILVNENMITDGMKYLLKEHRLIAEGAAAVGIGALLHKSLSISGDETAVIISGKNVDLSAYFQVVNGTR